MTASNNGAADTAIASSGAGTNGNRAGAVAGTTPKARRFRFRKFDQSVVHDAVHQATDQLMARIAELETELEDARNQVPDLSSLTNADLAVLASDAAASILRVARTEADMSGAAAQKLLADAQTEATRRIEEAEQRADEIVRTATERATVVREEAASEVRAKREASDAAIAEAAQRANEEAAELAAQAQMYSKEVCTEADTYAERVRTEADDHSAQVRAEAEAGSQQTLAEARATADSLISEAKKGIEARLAKANADAENIVNGALERREALFADLEVQRHLVQSTLEDAAAIQAAFVEGYGRLRKTLDESVAHLIEPVQRARRQLVNLDRELVERQDA